MIYLWNFIMWVAQLLPPIIRKPKSIAWVNVLIDPIKVLHTDFIAFRLVMIKKLRINGQTIVLENLLNDMFDNTLRRITIVTSFDTIDPVYVPQPGAEFASNPIWIAQPSENQPLYVGQPSEYGVLNDFIVEVPVGILTSAQEIQLKFIIYKYKLLSKTPLFKYDDGSTF